MKLNRWMGYDISPEKLTEFINSNWEMLAAYAWDRYKAGGRGLVRFDFMTARHEITGQAGYSLKVDYMADTAVRREAHGWPDPNIEQMVVEYDPENEVASISITPSGIEVRRDHAQGRLTPPEAYEAGYTPAIGPDPDRN